MRAEHVPLDARSRISIIRMLCENGHRPRLVMRGTSMLPMLREPMVLELDPVVGRPRIGAVIVFEQGNGLTAHRVVGFAREGILAAGDALSKAPDVVPRGRIVGKVARVWSSPDPGATRVDDALFRLRGALHAHERFVGVGIRRILSACESALLAANPRRRPRAFHVLFNALASVLQRDGSALQRHLASIDGRSLLETARRQRCAAILADGIEELGVAGAVDPRLRRGLQVARWSAALHAAMLRQQVQEVVALLRRHGLVPILLKGAARVYAGETRFDRHASRDIDLLLPADRIDDAREILHDAGYRELADAEYEAGGHYHAAPLFPARDGVPVEIHHALAPSGALRLCTDAASLTPRVRYVNGSSGTVGVLDDLGSALHLAIHARLPTTPLRDLVLLAQRLGAMTSAEREALYGIVDREGRERLRLHAMVYAAARLAGRDWPAPRAALRFLEWRLRRGDLPTPLRVRSYAVEAFMAAGGRSLRPILHSWVHQYYRDRDRGSRPARVARFVVHMLARIVFNGCAGSYALLMRRPNR